jgi:hypothetical protein
MDGWMDTYDLCIMLMNRNAHPYALRSWALIVLYKGVSRSFRTKSITNNNKQSFRSNTKGYGGKPHYTGSQNSNTSALSVRELYHLQFSLQAASPETFGYTLVLRSRIRILDFCMHLPIQDYVPIPLHNPHILGVSGVGIVINAALPSTSSRPFLTSVVWGPPSYAAVQGALIPGVKRPRRENDHSPPSRPMSRVHRAIPPLPNTSSWRGTWLSTRTTSPFSYFLLLCAQPAPGTNLNDIV